MVVTSFSSGPSSEVATPSNQEPFGETVSHTPPIPFESRSAVTVRPPVALMVIVSVPSSAPSPVRAVSPPPTLSRSLPLKASVTVTAGFTVNAWLSVAISPVGSVTLTLRVPRVAAPSILNVAVNCVGDTKTTLLTVMPAPALTVVPATNPVPVIVTGAANPTLPLLGITAVNVTAGGAN